MIRRRNLTTWLIISVFLAGFAPAVAAGGTIYVDAGAGGANNGSSWADAYLYLQDALAVAGGGDDIWVAAGTYYPDANTAVPDGSNDRTAMFRLINGVAIYGGFAGTETTLEERDWVTNETILSGDLLEDDGPGEWEDNGDNSYHVVTGGGTDATAVLDGFTITAGNANGSYPDNIGGGMYNNGSPTVTNCTFSGNQAVTGGGMYNNGLGSPTVTNCIFTGNSASDNGGGMYNDRSPTVTNCTFSGNSATWDGGGMYNSFGSSPTVTNCTFSGNSASGLSGGGGGMYNKDGNTTVVNCTFSGNSASIGSGMYDKYGNPTVTNCVFWNGTPIYPADINVTYSNVQGGYSGTGNINADPLFVDADGPDNVYGTADDDLRLSAGSPCIDSGDNNSVPADMADLDNDADTTERTPLDLDGEARFVDDPATADTGVADPPDYPFVVDMGAYEYGVIIYVDESATGANDGSRWEDAYNYLADALDVAGSGDNVLVAEGTYKPDEGGGETPGDRMATFQLINGVAIYGGFPLGGDEWSERAPNAYETILSGDLLGDDGPGEWEDNGDNSYHVVTGSDTEPSAVLDGFTVTAGFANGVFPNNYGGGIYNAFGSPTVTNCTFNSNYATVNGAGIYNVSGSPTVTNCTFISNSADDYGGGMCNMGGSPTVTNCTFNTNRADSWGGGMYNNFSNPTVTNCTFSGNSAVYGGGMNNFPNSNPAVTNCTFSGNSAEYSGGGMCNYNNSSPTIANCTFSGNDAVQTGGGIYNNSSDQNITNCILWGNTASGTTDESAQIYNDNSTPDVNYCCIEGLTGGLGGTGNIGDNPGDDPLFKDDDGADDVIGTEDDDVSLSFASPCIDAGDNSSVPADTADLDDDGDTSEPIPWDLAGNMRFTDDPVVIDTGNPPGADAIVEMGAYERYEFCGSGVYLHPDGDISGPDGVRDCRVDFFDFAVVAAHWLEDTGPE